MQETKNKVTELRATQRAKRRSNRALGWADQIEGALKIVLVLGVAGVIVFWALPNAIQMLKDL